MAVLRLEVFVVELTCPVLAPKLLLDCKRCLTFGLTQYLLNLQHGFLVVLFDDVLSNQLLFLFALLEFLNKLGLCVRDVVTKSIELVVQV